MSISGSFSNALSGLSVTGRLAEVASNNLANALTKGYARQSVDISARALEGRGVGVQADQVVRTSAPELTATRRLADGDAAAVDIQAEALARLGEAFGEVTGDDGLFRRVETFETTLRQLAETPEAEARQLAAVEAAKDVAGFLNSLSGRIATERQDADLRIAQQVETVNRNIQQIDALNEKITRLGAGGRDVAGLVNQRELLIDEVAAIIPVRVLPQENNKTFLTTVQGQFLLAEEPVELQFTRSPIITSGMIYDPLGGGALSGVTLNGQDLTPGASGAQVLTAGSLFGNFKVRDELGFDLTTQIDEFAADLIQRFENSAVDPTLLPGDAGLFTDSGAPLNPTIIDGLAQRISVNGLADPDQGGDPTRLRDGLNSVAAGPVFSDTLPRAMLDAMTLPAAISVTGLSGAKNTFQIVSSIASFTGEKRTRVEAEASALISTRESLAASEAREIGVDQDAELQSLIQIEQAYAANIQVIQTASRMLDELTEIR
ncbi:MAG: flagellar hook-associated protein FlgK [Pseudomonadota bacterium]